MRQLGTAILVFALGICWTAGIDVGAEPASSPTTQGAQDQPKVSIISLMVVREADGAAMRALMDSPAGGEYKAGVLLVGRVTLPVGNVVSVDKTLQVVKFADDLGTDLGNGLVKTRFSSDEGMQCYMAPDRKQCTFWLGSAKLPATGADKLLVEGSLNLQLGVGEKTAESKKLPVKLGQEFEAGALKLKVESISIEEREGGFSIAFSSPSALGQIKAIECIDGDGRQVAVQMQDARRSQEFLGIVLARPVKEMTLRVVQFERIENVKLPVKLEVKVGL